MHRIIYSVILAFALRLGAGEVKPVLTVIPSLSELGPAWTTNVIADLLDPHGQPSPIEYHHETETSHLLALQRGNMEKEGRNAFAVILYGRGNMIVNEGWYRVYIYRWDNRRALHNRWVDWKMNPARVVRSIQAAGDDHFWTDDGFTQDFTFRRGLFHVTIEAGSASEYRPMLWLAEVIDAKIRGGAVPEVDAATPRNGAVDRSEDQTTAALWAQDSATTPTVVPARYCCQMPSVGSVCVGFEADGTYTATGKLSGNDGTSRGRWKQQGDKLILVPQEETGCLIGYLSRFSIDQHEEGRLTWLPKKPQNFAHGGGAVVYPKYTKTKEADETRRKP